jgi:hypothetical protein
MTAHQLQLVRPSLQKLGGAERDVMMRRTVESITAHAFLLMERVRQTIEVGVSRQSVMKRRVENGHVRHRRKQTAHLVNPGDHHRIVQGRERIERFDLREQFVRDECAFRELLATVDQTMNDQTDVAGSRQHSGLFRGELGQHRLERLGKANTRPLAFELSFRPSVIKPGSL